MSSYQPTLPDAASSSHARVTREDVTLAPLSPAEVVIHIGDGGFHTVARRGDELECDCRGYRYHGRCAHRLAVERAEATDALELEDRRPTDADTYGRSSRI